MKTTVSGSCKYTYEIRVVTDDRQDLLILFGMLTDTTQVVISNPTELVARKRIRGAMQVAIQKALDAPGRADNEDDCSESGDVTLELNELGMRIEPG